MGVIFKGFFGLKLAILGWFCDILTISKELTPIYKASLSYQICTDPRAVKNPWKMGRNPPLGKEKKNATWRWSEPTCLFHGPVWTGVHLQCTGGVHAVYAECRLHWLHSAYDLYPQVTTYTSSICVL